MWIDLEMTDISDVERGRIMEVGVIFTGPTMEMLDPANAGIESCAPIAYHRVVSLTDEELAGSSDWSMHTHSVRRSPHAQSLLEMCATSTFTIEDIDAEVSSLVRGHARGRPMIIAGSSISCDRIFIQKYMPMTAALLHHRMIDVSTILELTRRMYPGIRFSHFAEQDNKHSAMSDIFSSLHLMHNLQSTVFMPMISTFSQAQPQSSTPPGGPPPPQHMPYSHAAHHNLMIYAPQQYHSPPQAPPPPPPPPPPPQQYHYQHQPGPNLILRQSIPITPQLMEMCISSYRTDNPTAMYCYPFPAKVKRC